MVVNSDGSGHIVHSHGQNIKAGTDSSFVVLSTEGVDSFAASQTRALAQ